LGKNAYAMMASEVLLISNHPDHGRILSEMLRSMSISVEQVSGIKDIDFSPCRRTSIVLAIGQGKGTIPTA
jgi:hypothetical protein